MAEVPDTVHVFVSTGRFRSFEEMRAYIDQTSTEDGDGIPSIFMREVALSEHEPSCIEAIRSECGSPIPLSELLAGTSYADQWLPSLDGSRNADAAVCVFAPNRVGRPEGCSLAYLGEFGYRIVHSEWLQRILRVAAQDAEPGAAADDGAG